MKKYVRIIFLILLTVIAILFVSCQNIGQEQYWKERLNNPIVNSSFSGWHSENITDTVCVKLPDGWSYSDKDCCLYDSSESKMAYCIISKESISYDDYCVFLSDCLNTKVIGYDLKLLTQHGTHDEATAYQLVCHTGDNQSITILQTGFSSYEENVDKCWFVFPDAKSGIEEIVSAITWAWQIRSF